MAKVILFGLRAAAELSHYYLTNDSQHEVVAFCVHKKYLPNENFFKSLPIIDFDEVEKSFPTSENCFFAPLSPIKMNTLREKIYYDIKKKGYEMISYISSKAIVNNCVIGENCFIQEGNTLQPFSKIGNNVMLWSDNTIAHHVIIKDHVSLTSNVVVGGNCVVEENCFLALNSCIRNGITVSKGTLVSLGTIITNNTEEWSVYMGNPAKKIGKNISKNFSIAGKITLKTKGNLL